MSFPTPSSKPFCQRVDGFPLPGLLPLKSYHSALSYQPRPDDIFIATYPKCGTTWAQHIMLLLFREGKPITSMLEFMMATPYIEFTGAKSVEQMPRPGAIKTHLPRHLAPISDHAKYIYISRNPKDCCVSYYYHMLNFPGHGFNGSFDQFFECFFTGDIDYGDFFDHLLGWYSRRNEPNVLFLTYEQMKENPEEVIMKIASFIDDKLYAEPLRNDPQKMKNIIKYSSFKHMKEGFNQLVTELVSMPKEDLMSCEVPEEIKKIFSMMPPMQDGSGGPNIGNFVRKGTIGDWKNYFTEEQSKRLDEKFAEKTKGTDLFDLWKQYM